MEQIWTIGHSTRSLASFVEILDAHGVRQIADVRTLPQSRRHPQFGRAALERALAAGGRRYRHFRDLGGLRQPTDDSPHTALRHRGLRGYADYMLTAAFDQAVLDLLGFAGEGPTAIMCAEAFWGSCHRALLADALVTRSVQVLHLSSAEGVPLPHALNQTVRLIGGRLIYAGRRQKPVPRAGRLIE